MNAIRIIALSVVLAAGGALAQGKKKTPPPMPKPILTEKDIPKTCADQCKVMEKVLVEPCKKGAGNNKAAQQACGKNSKQVVDACYGSCRDKGRVDKQYVLERIKPPKGYKPPQGGEEFEEGDHAH